MQEDRATRTQPQSSSDEQGAISPPVILLPNGSGAIRGMGEKFAANPCTGSISVPIYASPSRAGFGPHLSLSYDSGAGNGAFGFGWNLSLPSITRKTDKGPPRYQDADESDVFILSGAEDLVPVLDGNGQIVETEHDGYRIRSYRPRIEGLFARIERWIRLSDGDTHWRSISKENLLTIYSKDSESRIADPLNPRHIFSWLICETRDDKGNGIIYEYVDELGVDDYLVRSTEFTYDEKPIASFMTSVTQSSYLLRQPDSYMEKSLPPFAYTTHFTKREARNWFSLTTGNQSFLPIFQVTR